MAAKRKTVFDIIMYEYAKLIADRVVGKRSGLSPAARESRSYWGFVSHTFNQLTAETITPSSILRENQILVTNGSQCAYCGAVDTPLHWEHIVPISHNGSNTIDNLVLSCGPCNLQKGARNPVEWFDARGMDSGAIPRLIMGKLLKMVLEAHKEQGTERCSEYPPGVELSLAGVCRIFHRDDNQVNMTMNQERCRSAPE